MLFKYLKGFGPIFQKRFYNMDPLALVAAFKHVKDFVLHFKCMKERK